MTLDQLLIQLGINLTTSVIFEFIKEYKNSITSPTVEGLKEYLTPKLNIEGASIKADQIISFLAENGDIIIQQTNMHASDSIRMQSSSNTKLLFGNNSVSSTNKTRIEAGQGAHIIATGGASIHQGDDGSISFYS